MRCRLFCDKGGASLPFRMIVIIIIIFVVLLIVGPWFAKTFGMQLDVLGIFSGGSSNIQPITAECELACLDGDAGQFCTNLTSKPLRLGDGRSIKGSCEAISNVGSIGVFDGVKKCSRFRCGEVKEAVCSKGWGKYDCKTWLSEEDLKKLEEKKVAAALALKKEEELKKVVSFIPKKNEWEGVGSDYEDADDYNKFVLDAEIPVVSIASASYDPYFRQMKFEYLDELAKSDQFYIVYVDAPSYKESITKKVQVTPAIAYIDEENKNVGSSVGYLSYDEFVKVLKEKFGIVVDCQKCVDGYRVKKEKELVKVVRFASDAEDWWVEQTVDYRTVESYDKFFDYVEDTDYVELRKPIVVIFGASWSGGNRKIEADYLGDLARSDKLYVVYVDADEFEDTLVARYGVQSYPSALFWKDGNIVGSSAATWSRDEFVLLLKEKLGIEI